MRFICELTIQITISIAIVVIAVVISTELSRGISNAILTKLLLVLVTVLDNFDTTMLQAFSFTTVGDVTISRLTCYDNDVLKNVCKCFKSTEALLFEWCEGCNMHLKSVMRVARQ